MAAIVPTCLVNRFLKRRGGADIGNWGFVWSMEEGLGVGPQPMHWRDQHMLVFPELPGGVPHP